MRKTNKKLKLRPHYFWLCGLFMIGGLITAAIVSSPETSETHALSGPEDEWRTLADITYMQDITAKICENSTIWTTVNKKTYTLKDKRDDKDYSIARIRNKAGEKGDDGNYLAHCWMTKNLALDLETKWNSTYMTTEYTDVPNNSYFSGIGTTPTKKNDGFTMGTGGTGYAGNQVMEYTNGSLTVTSDVAYSSTYGYYYTWCAATVGCKSGSSYGSQLTNEQEVDASICPAGWKLPSGGTNGEWYKLLNDIGKVSNSYVNALKVAPYNLPAAGYMYSEGLSGVGSYGYYGSRTAFTDANRAYVLYFSGGNLYPGTNNYNRYFGISVRCVADTTDPEVYPEIPDDPNNPSLKDSSTSTFSIEVKDAITVAGVKFTDGSGQDVILSAMPGELVNGKIDVIIGSNVAYKINLSAAEPDLTSSSGDSYQIPAITQPLTAEQLKTNYGWGVMKKTNSSTDDTVYTGLTTTGETFYTSDTPAGASTATQFNVGVSVPPTLPADTYSTEVTITAIATQ